jgi:NAD(P)-dependent dehydrogenase (short-subunit alcohol dehydrogenase family)
MFVGDQDEVSARPVQNILFAIHGIVFDSLALAAGGHMRLKNKVAIVTGAGAGIGEAIAWKFAREGARIMVAGLPRDPVRDVAAAIVAAGGEAEAYPGDLAEEAGARSCIDMTVQRFSHVDVLVNNAGVFVANAATELYQLDDFDRTIRNNLRTAFLMTKFALPHLKKTRGNILFTGSEAGFNGSPMMAPYGGTKGFLHAFMKGVALEQAAHGIRANCVCPGPIDTAWTRGPESPIEPAQQRTIDTMVPLGRRGAPEEIANIFAFLASDEASYVTGALWLADGGVTPAKSDLGAAVPAEFRNPPAGVLPLQHSHDGLKHKDVHRAPK